MPAAKPAQAPVSFMAGNAYLVLGLSRGWRASAKNDCGFHKPTMSFRPGVVLAGPMAGFALQLGKRRVRIQAGSVRCIEYRSGGKFRCLTMAKEAGIRTTAAELLSA